MYTYAFMSYVGIYMPGLREPLPKVLHEQSRRPWPWSSPRPKVLREQSPRVSNRYQDASEKCTRRRGQNIMFDTNVRGAEARVQNDC